MPAGDRDDRAGNLHTRADHVAIIDGIAKRHVGITLGAIAALYGGGLVAWLYGGVDPEAFLLRLRDAISIDHFTVGIIKAPVMAAVIGIVACVEGLAVQGSAESLGQHTTASVVKGIFFVIVMDGVFAIFFASIGM